MISRRTFFGAALGIPTVVRAGPNIPECRSSGFSQVDYQAFQPPTTNNNFQPETSDPGHRPTWSALLKDVTALNAYVSAFHTAYQKMLVLPFKDPHSLAYQAGLHYHYCLGVPGQVSSTDQMPLIHRTSAFLPWHRAFLFYFERLVQYHSGMKNFRLAAWDWEKDNRVPEPYNQWRSVPTMNGCALSRMTGVANVADLTGWLQSTISTDFQGAANFGPHAAGGPHNTVHQSTGDFMHRLDLAALDTLFYAHHANIDRLWEAWRQRYQDVPHFFDQQTWPAVPAAWTFYDAKIGDFVSVKARDMLDLTSLRYDYNPPTLNLFDYVSLVGTGTHDWVRFQTGDTAKFARALAEALGNPAATVNNLVSIVLGMAVKLATASLKVVLPIVVRLALPHDAIAGMYRLKLETGNVTLGSFAVLEGHHMDSVTAFVSVGINDLPVLLRAPLKGLRIICVSGANPKKRVRVELKSFELHYPTTLEGWKKLFGT